MSDDIVPVGTQLHIVEEEGGTFAFYSAEDADQFALDEVAGGFEEVKQWSIIADREGLTLYDWAERA